MKKTYVPSGALWAALKIESRIDTVWADKPLIVEAHGQRAFDVLARLEHFWRRCEHLHMRPYLLHIYGLGARIDGEAVKRNNALLGKAKHFICWRCNEADAQDWHHIIPISQGGINAPINAVPLCRLCHKRTHYVDYRETDAPVPRRRYRETAQTRGIEQKEELIELKGGLVVPARILRFALDLEDRGIRLTPNGDMLKVTRHDGGKPELSGFEIALIRVRKPHLMSIATYKAPSAG